MLRSRPVLLFGVYLHFVALIKCSEDLRCNVRARIDSGWVCGLLRDAELGIKYASYRGIPYAEQPVGDLRFKELQPPRPWPYHLDATEEGPICPQHDELYGGLVNPIRGMSEACIFANVHVPFEALPVVERADYDKYYQNNKTGYKGITFKDGKGLPILVFIHGGGFVYGSGNPDLHGPEYLVSKGIIVITFNYRLNFFGFLSIPPKIPGNNALRDQVTLLRWVKRNARAFGGNPDEVTLAGQSAGSASAHLLSLSKVTHGLFKRVILMSGTAIPSFYTTSPVYASIVAERFLSLLGINSTEPEFTLHQLNNIPLERILKALSIYQYESGLQSFTPVVESISPGYTRIIDDDPIALINRGRGKEYPLIVGFTSNECEVFRWYTVYLDYLGRVKKNPLIVLAGRIPFSTPPNVALYLANVVIDRYFHKGLNYDEFMEVCRDTYFEYPAFKLTEWRSKMNSSAPVYLYQFSYEADFSVMKKALQLQYRGATHAEDLTYVFKENAILGKKNSFPPKNDDDLMRDWMTSIVVNFMRCNKPACDSSSWPPVHEDILNYQDIRQPAVFINKHPSSRQKDMIRFFDKVEEISRNGSIVGDLPTRSGDLPIFLNAAAV